MADRIGNSGLSLVGLDLKGFDEMAIKALSSFSAGFDGLSEKECGYLQAGDEYVNGFQCDILRSVAGTGADGEVTDDEMLLLEYAGFSREFIHTLANGDGKRLQRLRSEWLAGIVADGDTPIRERIIAVNELGAMGAVAFKHVGTIQEAIAETGHKMICWDAPMFKDSLPDYYFDGPDIESDVPRLPEHNIFVKVDYDTVPVDVLCPGKAVDSGRLFFIYASLAAANISEQYFGEDVSILLSLYKDILPEQG